MSWQSDYQACDTLQMNCSTLEHPGLAEMSGLRSSLTQRGRKICDQIAESTGRPTYYYLFRYSGRKDRREKRLNCPSCHRGWRLVLQGWIHWTCSRTWRLRASAWCSRRRYANR